MIAKTPTKLVVMFGPNFGSVASDLPAVADRINGAMEERCEELGLK